MVYRRFGYLQSRLLLEKQDDLRRLESALDRLDKNYFNGDETALMSRHDIEEPESAALRELLHKIETKFHEYCMLVFIRFDWFTFILNMASSESPYFGTKLDSAQQAQCGRARERSEVVE